MMILIGRSAESITNDLNNIDMIKILKKNLGFIKISGNHLSEIDNFCP